MTMGHTLSATGKQIGFIDCDFPAGPSSLAPTLPGREDLVKEYSVEWRHLNQWKHKRLFKTIEPADIMQGEVGDCWLLSAMSAMAEFPGHIQWLLHQESSVPHHDLQLHDDGKYAVRLFDVGTKAWKDIVIDDSIPFLVGIREGFGLFAQPLLSRPKDDEAWCLLLEKAMAKHLGSYGNLDGGDSVYAWAAWTGSDQLLSYRRGPYESNAQHQEDPATGKPLWCGYLMKITDPKDPNSTEPEFTGERFTDDEMWKKLCLWDAENYCMGASIVGAESEKSRKDGLVEMHAYSLLSAVQIDTGAESIRLSCLRNPWGGSFEWNGAWADHSSEWKSYPAAQALLHHEFKKDGVFWMDFSEWSPNCFNYISVCKHAMAPRRQKSLASVTSGVIRLACVPPSVEVSIPLEKELSRACI